MGPSSVVAEPLFKRELFVANETRMFRSALRITLAIGRGGFEKRFRAFGKDAHDQRPKFVVGYFPALGEIGGPYQPIPETSTAAETDREGICYFPRQKKTE